MQRFDETETVGGPPPEELTIQGKTCSCTKQWSLVVFLFAERVAAYR